MSCALGGAPSGEAAVRAAYSEKVRELEATEKKLRAQADRVASLRLQLQQSQDTVAELRQVISYMGSRADVSSVVGVTGGASR